MTSEHTSLDAASHAPNRVGSTAHAPHTHDHVHRHEHAHGAHAHTHAAASPDRTHPPRISLLMRSATLRLAAAVALSALLWAAVAWALSGTP